MDTKFKKLLNRYYEDIVEDLDVQYILDKLFAKQVVSNEEFDHILSKLNDRTECVRYLIEVLIQNGSNSRFEAFVDSLSKDYHWLWEKLSVDCNDISMNDSSEDSLSKGDVPRPPDYHVPRHDVEKLVADKLKQLKRHQILALHGMSGSGKTCVAISVLRDNPNLVTTDFNGVISWLNLGNCRTEDDIIALQTKLLKKTSSMYGLYKMNSTSISMSSIGSNGDSHSFSTLDWTSLELKDRLKAKFSEEPLKESLLVLDEVNDRACVDAFDIGCKILITTRDREVVANYQPIVVTIENNFKKEETQKLFALCLDEPVDKLPRQAKVLHELCKGSPYNIALIGAQLAENKEQLKHDPRRWDYYVKKLQKKEFSTFFTRPNDDPMRPIAVCINSLNSTILPLFKRLAILPDNIKISGKALSKLWNKEVQEVETIMKQLKSKSLITENYNREQRTYIYEIHDLIMTYLRRIVSDDEKNKFHDNMLNSYNYNNNNSPVELADDGYIAYYIGYHILHTNNVNGRWSLFKNLYLNLKFLGNKVRLTGPADVLLDLQKYEEKIAKDEQDKELINSIKAYLSTHGTDLYHYQCTDIVQSILQHESKGILYSKASLLAQENANKNELYFDFLHEQDVDSVRHSTIDVKESISTVCFYRDYVIVGTYSGSVKFFYIPTNKLKKEINEGESIKWIGIACPADVAILTALMFNGTIKLTPLHDLEEDTDENDEGPFDCEEHFNNNRLNNMTIASKRGPFIHCRWADNDTVLIAQTNTLIILYNTKGEVLSEIDAFKRDCMLLCCVPCSHDDRYVAVATAGSCKGVELVDLKKKEVVITFVDPATDNDPVLDILAVYENNKIITLKQREIAELAFTLKSGTISKCNVKSRTIIQSSVVKESLSFKSMVANKSGTLLFVSTDDSRVMCIDLKTYAYVFDLENRRGNVTAMAVSEIMVWDEFDLVPGTDVLLTASDHTENAAKVWYLDASYVSQNTKKNGKVRLTTKFDASFLNVSSPQTPSSVTPSVTDIANNSPKRHQSFANHKETKKMLKNTLSSDRHTLKPLNLKGVCNNSEGGLHPLLAVVDDRNNIQVMRGRKILTKISENANDKITCVVITPCNQNVIFGLHSGTVQQHTLRTKEVFTIMDVNSPVHFMKFVNENLLVVAGKNRCVMAYSYNVDGIWTVEMLQRGNTHLGSQEILNDMQGLKLGKAKNGQHDNLSSDSSSETSVASRDRLFSGGDSNSRLCERSGLVDCFWTSSGLITVENNATIKLWNHREEQSLQLIKILNARQLDVNVTCTAFKKNILVICFNNVFQTFVLKEGLTTELQSIEQSRPLSTITSCDLTNDGNVLAMGLDSGSVVVRSVKNRRQLCLLNHHKGRVHCCRFSPVPERLYRSSGQWAGAAEPAEAQPPLVLVTAAAEVLWWNLTYVLTLKNGLKNAGRSMNALTPLASPLESRAEAQPNNNNSRGAPNFFFSDGLVNQLCWKTLWKGKTCKEGSKRKEILACIKLTGTTAKKVCHDDRFSCFVTVDKPGHIHIMNAIRSNIS